MRRKQSWNLEPEQENSDNSKALDIMLAGRKSSKIEEAQLPENKNDSAFTLAATLAANQAARETASPATTEAATEAARETAPVTTREAASSAASQPATVAATPAISQTTGATVTNVDPAPK